ncbi:hypothetical protein Pst134EA_019732 [Puccinia striiformis f. sp. tritici]|uniref:hypothetical protein n=1 Tax=Puccinia striiformis f. sp. tritici TaxID=168172 RepID=UPI00200831F9|nr:hypothetical protein Pst134EA_019732 [Puccinia striiformis f. sp. tritici]KAH9449839.1 hypothetical protein Pst134EB_020649 [Puccinia striiformis f. sp. tritici]KAH9459590.1 hypothetical protein Pst134EA_019732 [Puccinia striiformis f. sp. tritici]
MDEQARTNPVQNFSDSAEFKHYRRIINAFDEYRRYSLAINNRRRKDYYRLSLKDQSLLEDYPLKLNEVDDRIRRNADILDEIVFKGEQSGLGPKISSEDIQVDDDPVGNSEREQGHDSRISGLDAEKVRSTLRQLVRDWSTLGSAEREACYSPILDRLERFAESSSGHISQKSDIRVLVPGSGLARLVWEIAHRGFTAQGNEVSYPMLLASNLVLNHSESIDQWSIYPFIHSFSNLSCIDHLLKQVKFPDVLVPEVSNRQDFGISVGEFTEIFASSNEHEKWDAIVTCFFLDTAQNIVEYIRRIHQILKSNGIWINLGPTLWHYESSSNPRDLSIELDVCEIKELCKKIGFDFEVDSEKVIETTYAGNPHINLQQVYKASYWVCTKK